MNINENKLATIETFLQEILLECYRQGATDIHLEPSDDSYHFRCRIGGRLFVLYSLNSDLSKSVIARIKLMSGMDPASRLTAQDGRFSISKDSIQIDFRVSAIPLVEGESIVLRVLDPLRIRLSLDELGMRPKVADAIRETIRKAHGMLLVCGPTGAGKTTTLYATLEEMDRVHKKILSAEDPVEYLLEDCTQVAVQPHANLGFAALIRSFLRQDPDVILVGEIRDSETAKLAFRAGLTGHMILTSIHSSNTVQAITRLLHMGVSPSILTSVLTHVIAQRLMRRLCTRCRQEIRNVEGKYWNAVGCTQCFNQGYIGQIGIFESVRMSKEILLGIKDQLSVDDLKNLIFRNSENTDLKKSSRLAVESGLTTWEEVDRCL